MIEMIRRIIAWFMGKPLEGTRPTNIRQQFCRQSSCSRWAVLVDSGLAGEYATYMEAAKFTAANQIVASCYVPKYDGNTTEIDSVLIHPTGIYVFESKNYSGDISGSESDRYWTQTLYSESRGWIHNQLYNPIMQNQGHVNHLKSYLKRMTGRRLPVYSYVVFTDVSDITRVQTSDEARVLHLRALSRVLKADMAGRPQDVLSTRDMAEVFALLDGLSHASRATRAQHLASIT